VSERAETEGLAAAFHRFAAAECDASPLYRALANAVAADAELLAIAAVGERQPKPNLFLAAVHELLLAGAAEHPLAGYFATVVSDPKPAEGAAAHLRDFAVRHRTAIEERMRTRLVQTNEVARAAVVRPGLAWAGQRLREPVVFIEVGCSAGLLLATDCYRVRYSDASVAGPAESEVVIDCEARGAAPPVAVPVPDIARRIGIDLNPVRVTNEADRRWIEALVWGDQPDRLARMRAALAAVTSEPPETVAGDANEVLPRVLSELPAGQDAVVLHAHTLNQFSVEARERFQATLVEASRERAIVRLSLEGAAGLPHPLATGVVYGDGAEAERVVLAEYHAHGRWVSWRVGV
jgi:hypothetical protein